MTYIRTLTLTLCASLLLGAGFGCAGRSPATYYYVLDGEQKTATDFPAPKTAVQLRRVDVPAYLDRNAIVTRASNNVQVTLSEYHQWAESLNYGMRRVLATALLPRLAEKQVTLEPLDADETGPLQIFVQVLRFEGNFGGDVLLDARWTLRTHNDKIIAQGSFMDSSPAGMDYESLVKAQSHLLIRFGEAMALPLSKASLAYSRPQ